MLVWCTLVLVGWCGACLIACGFGLWYLVLCGCGCGFVRLLVGLYLCGVVVWYSGFCVWCFAVFTLWVDWLWFGI